MVDPNVSVPLNGGSEQGPGADAAAGTGEFIRMTDAQKLINEAVTTAVRQAQSLTDKSAYRLNQQLAEVKNTLSSLQSAGTPVPADTLAAMRDITNSLDVSGGAYQSEQPKGPEAIDNAPEVEEAEVNRAAMEIFKSAGVVVNLDDPEAKMIDYSTPEEFLKTLPLAAASKANRMKADQARPPMMLGRGGSPNPIDQISKPGDLYAIALGERRR